MYIPNKAAVRFQGPRLHSSGGASSSIISVCPEESVTNCSNVFSGTPVYEIEMRASEIGYGFFTDEVTFTCTYPLSAASAAFSHSASRLLALQLIPLFVFRFSYTSPFIRFILSKYICGSFRLEQLSYSRNLARAYDNQNNFMISLYITTAISTISNAKSAKCTIPSFSGGTRFLRIASL